jgi:hypothetical protein
MLAKTSAEVGRVVEGKLCCDLRHIDLGMQQQTLRFQHHAFTNQLGRSAAERLARCIV